MADFSFTVDTTPLAHSVDSAKGHLNGVTVAVTAMEAAVIASEREASRKICENVDEGFFMLVKSQISQKAVAAFSEMSSTQMKLLQLDKAVDNVKKQMENDFYMITRRYAKLFQSLNKALETRIKELDRPAMQLSEIRKNLVFEKLNNDSAMFISVSTETLPLALSALSSNLKQKTKKTLQTLSESIYENKSYNEKVESILIKNDNSLPNESDVSFLPSIFFVTDSLLNSDDSIENIYTAQTDVWQNTAPIVSQINSIQKNLHWESLDEDQKLLIRKTFLDLCEQEPNDERISKEIIRLFDDSTWEVCKNEL